MQNVSSGPYLCPKHTRCHSCGSTVPGNGSSVRYWLLLMIVRSFGCSLCLPNFDTSTFWVWDYVYGFWRTVWLSLWEVYFVFLFGLLNSCTQSWLTAPVVIAGTLFLSLESSSLPFSISRYHHYFPLLFSSHIIRLHQEFLIYKFQLIKRSYSWNMI